MDKTIEGVTKNNTVKEREREKERKVYILVVLIE